MNRQKIIERLFKMLESVSKHPRFIKDLIKIIKESGVELKFFQLLEIRLETLMADPSGVMLSGDDFEHLGDGIYSMHIDVQKLNVRILYYIDDSNKPCLLLPFFERGGKNATNYSLKIPAAQARRDEMKGW